MARRSEAHNFFQGRYPFSEAPRQDGRQHERYGKMRLLVEIWAVLIRKRLEIFAVEFCPYQPLEADPVFAVVSKKHV
jgi:hypothetical protein